MKGIDYKEYKSLPYATRTVISMKDDKGNPYLQAALTHSYEFTNQMERDYAASVFEKDEDILKVVKWKVIRANGQNKGKKINKYFVCIYWWRKE